MFARMVECAPAGSDGGRSTTRTDRGRPGVGTRPLRQLCRDGAGFSQELLQLAVAIHLQGDIAPADQLTIHIELRVGRPVRVALERLAQLRLLENVDVLELGADGP